MIHKIKTLINTFRYRKKPWKYLLGFLLVRTGLNKNISFKRMDGYKLNLSKSSLALAYYAGEVRLDEELFLRKILKEGDTYVDVGANIGTLVLNASIAVLNSGTVIGIEAHPETFKNLQANVKLNKFKNIKLIQSAVGSSKGELFFSNINSDDQNKVLLNSNNGIRVEVNTLDHLLSEYENISILKIDVEGYEKHVLSGAQNTLKKTNIVLFESSEEFFANFGYTTRDVLRILNNAGFEVYKKYNKNLKMVNSDYSSKEDENLIALKDASLFTKQFGFNIVN